MGNINYTPNKVIKEKTKIFKEWIRSLQISKVDD